MKGPYATKYAAFYDLFYRDKPYVEEVKFVERKLRECGIGRGSRVLELACGTGEHALRFAMLGYAITATDASQAMVDLARGKARRRSVPAQFAKHDMTNLPVPVRPFDAVICLFDSIGYVRTDAAISAVLRGVWQSLRPGGIFVVEYWHAPAMTRGFDPIRVRRFTRGGATVFRVSETKLEPRRSLAHVTYSVYDMRTDSTYRHFKEWHANRYFTVDEMSGLARAHGFTPLWAYDGFRDTEVTDATWHVLALWQKNQAATPVAISETHGVRRSRKDQFGF